MAQHHQNEQIPRKLSERWHQHNGRRSEPHSQRTERSGGHHGEPPKKDNDQRPKHKSSTAHERQRRLLSVNPT